jgi:hypothetical protein
VMIATSPAASSNLTSSSSDWAFISKILECCFHRIVDFKNPVKCPILSVITFYSMIWPFKDFCSPGSISVSLRQIDAIQMEWTNNFKWSIYEPENTKMVWIHSSLQSLKSVIFAAGTTTIWTFLYSFGTIFFNPKNDRGFFDSEFSIDGKLWVSGGQTIETYGNNKWIIQGFQLRQMDVGFFFKGREFIVSMDINKGSTFETTEDAPRSFLPLPIRHWTSRRSRLRHSTE